MIKIEKTISDKGVVNIHKIFEEPALKNKKAFRADELYNSTVTYNDIVFDADEMSMDRMSRILAVASNNYNIQINNGVDSSVAFNNIYNTQIPWKIANNSIVYVTPIDLTQILNLALEKMAEIWFKY